MPSLEYHKYLVEGHHFSLVKLAINEALRVVCRRDA